MDDRASIQVHEIVEVQGESVHREKYAYFLVVDDEEIGGYERDPNHTPAEHRHCGQHQPGGKPYSAVSFKDAVRDAWDWLARHPYDPAE